MINMGIFQQQVIILGAGKSKQFLENPSIIHVDQETRTLDWLLNAFDKAITRYLFVGGYKMDEITHHYPYLHFVVNPIWKHSGCIESLRLSDFDPQLPAFVCYGDILVRPELVQKLLQTARQEDVDAVFALDSDPKTIEVKPDCECIYCNFNGNDRRQNFIGLIYLKPNVLGQLKHNFPSDSTHQRLSSLLPYLLQNKFNIQTVDAHGLWVEVQQPSDVARFILTTKAQTLHTLRHRITKAKIAEQVHFSVQEWQNNRQAIRDILKQTFGEKLLVVRSSSLQEDGFSKANAGKFTSVADVQNNDADLTRAVETVIASYGQAITPEDQILVQPMLQNVDACGVIFTRTLNYGAPYYIVNYDIENTTAITSGTSDSDFIFYHWKTAPIPKNAPYFFKDLYEAIQEIEFLTQFDALDIEFAITKTYELYIFQVRPLAAQHLREIDDNQLQEQLQQASKRFEDMQRAHPGISGHRTIFGIMPDWNPAEIVGIKPRTLAITLYQQLITHEIWAQQRYEFGYKDVRPYPLIVCFSGHPYVDVRASIHSFLPANLKQTTTEKLVHYYLNRLSTHPEWHDKLEFMVMPTCYTFDFEDRWRTALTREAGLSEDEFESYKQDLLRLTRDAFQKCTEQYKATAAINERFEAIQQVPLSDLDRLYTLFETCKRGTLNFSHLARCGFIASVFLKSALAKNMLTEGEKEALLGDIQTITGTFFEETKKVLNGQVSRTHFIHKYGHLRPGTYDITSPAYKTDPDKYLFGHTGQPITTEITSKNTFHNPTFEKILSDTLSVSLDTFRQFLQQSIAGREYSKFVFTRYVSEILDILERLGQTYGLSPDDVSYLPIATWLDLRNGIASDGKTKRLLKAQIAYQKEYHQVAQCIELPPLILQQSDFFSFFVPKTLPNFIGNQCVEAPLVYLKNSNETNGNSLRHKIVLIEKADPGFDWIFNYEISGLITVYGGPNSHMAIRSAEFKLPASIGIGNALFFNRLKTAQLVQLDCNAHTLKIIR
ncbi:MAG: NTP transferase domain-containing protein [Puniceicoccales bacterium]|jgi:choline kinase|nr:NTP transferase domain-containing protein [Puniceicoccales bacterium]